MKHHYFCSIICIITCFLVTYGTGALIKRISDAEKTSCERPPSGLNYTIFDENDNELELSSSGVPFKSKIIARCRDGYERLNKSRDETANQESTCSWNGLDSVWYPSLKECYKSCEPVASYRHVSLESCTHRGKVVDCSDILFGGTSAFAKCEQGYYERAQRKRKDDVSYCSVSGVWLNLPYCVTDSVEIITVKSKVRIQNG